MRKDVPGRRDRWAKDASMREHDEFLPLEDGIFFPT